MARAKEEARVAAMQAGQPRYMSDRPCSKGHLERYTQTGVCCECQRRRTKGNKKPKITERHAPHTMLRDSPQITNRDIYRFEFRESIVGGEGQEHVVNDGVRETPAPVTCTCGDVGSHTLAECESFPSWKLPREERNGNRAVEGNVRHQEYQSGGCKDDFEEEGELPPAMVHHRRVYQKAKVEEIHIGNEV